MASNILPGLLKLHIFPSTKLNSFPTADFAWGRWCATATQPTIFWFAGIIRSWRRQYFPELRRSSATWRRTAEISYSERDVSTLWTQDFPSAINAIQAAVARRSMGSIEFMRFWAQVKIALPLILPICAWHWRRSYP